MTVYAVLYTAEDGDQNVHVFPNAQLAAETAAIWLSGLHEINGSGSADGYMPSMLNAANDGDDTEFISNDDVWRVRIFRREMPDGEV